ncbi:MAG TPA: M1 family metallopeptidase [Allosphingosinicella sp.]|nr:M1 family metallopeptidase [Allosphingosinicella sp.]
MFKLARIVRSGLAAAALLLAACNPGTEAGNNQQAEAAEASGERMVAPVLLTEDARDIHSYARPEVARVTHVALNLGTNFRDKRLEGYATLDIETRGQGDEVVLDSKGLEIESIVNAEGQPLKWQMGQADENLGAPLTVQLDGAKRIRIKYKSAPDAAALQWLSPEQTAGKKRPFLFSQGQAILNRSWIPTQDSPGIRQTWEARIVVPQGLRAVMSGEDLTPQGEPAPGGKAYRFRMDKPVAPYLIALAVGDIAFQSLGERSGVYAEPSMLKAAANELGDTEKMIDAAEKLYGPYRWDRYDMIVLPPSFPFGGMENPRLTFLTPTMIAGDRSLVSLIAHELAHSWSGNLVTNATWSDFWLNEGFTSYFENRIMEELYGRDRAVMEQALAWEDLHKEIQGMEGGMTSPGSRLHIDLKGKDPDEGMTGVPYDKGAAFLRTIEQTVGRERFDAYLRSYFDRYAFQPMTTKLFLEDLRKNLIKGDQALEEKLRIDEWVYQPGIPANAAAPASPAFARVDQAAQRFAAGAAPESIGFGNWSTAERVRFLGALPRQIAPERLAALDRAYRLSETRNSEVLFMWLRLAIANRYDPAVPAIERFLTSMGRRKFVAPLFEDLVGQGEWGRPIAERIYAKARPTYHSVTTGTVDKILKGGGEG